MFCIKCGTKLPDEAAFCPSCGAPVALRTQPPANTTSGPEAPVQPLPANTASAGGTAQQPPENAVPPESTVPPVSGGALQAGNSGSGQKPAWNQKWVILALIMIIVVLAVYAYGLSRGIARPTTAIRFKPRPPRFLRRRGFKLPRRAILFRKQLILWKRIPPWNLLSF